MPDHAYRWQLYISAYTALLGIPLLLFPRATLPLIGFDAVLVDMAPFVRLTGMFLLGLTMVTFSIWQRKVEVMVLGTVFLRIFIIVTLLIVGYTGGFPFLYLMTGVVAVGVMGTLWSLRRLDLKKFL